MTTPPILVYVTQDKRDSHRGRLLGRTYALIGEQL